MTISLPPIGLGTWPMRGREGTAAVISAIEKGYRLIDSAFNYENEGVVGTAVRTCGVPREELIITSKLPGRHHMGLLVVPTIEETVARMGLDHIDLYLIHWPNPSQELYVDAWKGMIEAKEAGIVKHIGVSNFLPDHIEKIEAETGVRPEVNQIELHPMFPQLDQLQWHEEKGIIVEGWSPLRRGNEATSAPAVTEVAAAHGITPAQAILAWHRAIGSLPLPKSSDPVRQSENLAAMEIELTDDEVASISALGRPDGRQADQNPEYYEEM